MVENCDFLKRLRNVHLEKSAVTGFFHSSRSPKTAKTPAKVHLRLRFHNLGKPRTAGLCGRAAGISDCGLLSCTKIERPSPLEKPPCKVRLFAQNRSRKYCQKVTVATLFQTVSHPAFQLCSQMPHICFRRQKWIHTRLSEKDRTQRLTRRSTGASLLLLPGASHFSLTFWQRKAGGSGCTPVACVRFPWHRGPAGLRGLIIRLPTLRSLGIVRRFGRVSVPLSPTNNAVLRKGR